MRRVLFSFRGIRVWSYPVLLYVGLLGGFYVNYAIAPAIGMDRERAALATVILFAPALAGARLWFVIDHWTIYRREPRRIWRHAEGGLTLYGGLVLSLVLSPPILAVMPPPHAGGDATAPALSERVSPAGRPRSPSYLG